MFFFENNRLFSVFPKKIFSKVYAVCVFSAKHLDVSGNNHTFAMMKKCVILYHGSSVAVEQPQILISGFYKDFVFGFYCTKFEKQARKWALTKRGNSIVSIYHYLEDDSLKVLSFPEMTDEWLDFVVSCRRGIKHNYDIVEGPMADDQIWDYVEDFMDGSITREAFWVLAKFKYPTHQMVFCTQKSLECLTYERSIEL